jgi:hypothetical protein
MDSVLSSLQLQTLNATWNTRKLERRHQFYNDILYDIVARDIIASRSEIYNQLLEKTRLSNTPRQLSIPIWKYNGVVYLQTLDTHKKRLELEHAYEDRNEKIGNHIRYSGYQWYIGCVNPEFDVQSAGFIRKEADWNRYWAKSPIPIRTIVTKTDFLERIALLFGDNFHVTERRSNTNAQFKSDCLKCETFELYLHYYPNGLPEYLKEDYNHVLEKYSVHIPARIESDVTPYLWKGYQEPTNNFRTPPRPTCAQSPNAPFFERHVRA